MSQHRAEVLWVSDGGDFAANHYSRAHLWRFDGGVEVPASASPAVVRLPYAREDAVDPEEAFVASLASCHMLWFLDFARRDGLAVAGYRDAAVGHMARDAQGAYWIARVELNIRVDWDGVAPEPTRHAALHERAHHACFIANSVKTEIVTNIE